MSGNTISAMGNTLEIEGQNIQPGGKDETGVLRKKFPTINLRRLDPEAQAWALAILNNQEGLTAFRDYNLPPGKSMAEQDLTRLTSELNKLGIPFVGCVVQQEEPGVFRLIIGLRRSE